MPLPWNRSAILSRPIPFEGHGKSLSIPLSLRGIDTQIPLFMFSYRFCTRLYAGTKKQSFIHISDHLWIGGGRSGNQKQTSRILSWFRVLLISISILKSSDQHHNPLMISTSLWWSAWSWSAPAFSPPLISTSLIITSSNDQHPHLWSPPPLISTELISLSLLWSAPSWSASPTLISTSLIITSSSDQPSHLLWLAPHHFVDGLFMHAQRQIKQKHSWQYCY